MPTWRASSRTGCIRNTEGSELVTNGTFDSNITGWTNGGGAAAYDTLEWSSGTLHAVTDGSGIAYAYGDAFSVTSGGLYAINYSIVLTSGTGPTPGIINSALDTWLFMGGSGTPIPLGTGSYGYKWIATATEDIRFSPFNTAAASNFTIDNASVKLLTPSLG